MTTDVDWRELIDRSFGDGPDHPPLGERLTVGRRALLRRRFVMGVAAVALTVVAGGTAWAAQPSEPRSEAPVVDDTQPDEQHATSARDAVTWTGSGWEVAPEWTVIDRIPNPMGYEPPRRSVALELENPPYRRLVLAVYDGDCCTNVGSVPASAGTLDEWLFAVAPQRSLDGGPVRFGAGDRLVAADGVTIVEQIPDPHLPANFAMASERTAAARIDDHGREMYVIVREIAGHEDVISFTGRFDSLDEFLRFARQQYASEEGLL